MVTDAQVNSSAHPPKVRGGRRRYGVLALLVGLAMVYWFGPQWCLQLAERQMTLHDWEGAVRCISLSEWGRSTQGQSSFLRARWHRRLGDLASMIPQLQLASKQGFDPVRLDREFRLADAQRGNLAPLEAILPQLLIDGNDLPVICEAYALGSLMNYRIADAEQVLELWSADFPNDPQPHFFRGRLLEHRSELGDAETEFRAALAQAPRHAPAAYHLARILLRKQELQQALDIYRVVADNLFEPQPGLVGIARCQRDMNQWDAARATLEQAIARPVDRLEEAYRYLGEPTESALAQAFAEMAQLEIASGHDAESIPWLEKALGANAHDWKLRYTYSTVLGRLGRTAEALTESQRSMKSRTAIESCDRLIDRLNNIPDDLEARYEVGCVLLEHASENQGLVWLKSIFAYDPDYRPAHARLAEYFSAHRDENPEYPALAEEHRKAAQAELPAAPLDKVKSP